MLTESRAELRRSRDRPPGGMTAKRVRGSGSGLLRSLAWAGGGTDAMDWRSDPYLLVSDPYLLVILAWGVNRERDAREKDRFPWRRDELTSQLNARVRPYRHAFNPQEVHSDADAVRSVPRV